MLRNEQRSHHRERNSTREHCLPHAAFLQFAFGDGRPITSQSGPEQEENADEIWCGLRVFPEARIDAQYHLATRPDGVRSVRAMAR
jgi:hypothetical protein